MNISGSDKVKKMLAGGQMLVRILNSLEKMSRPGVNLLDVEHQAWTLIAGTGGSPSFAKVPGYRWATCLNINDGLVHGVPRDYILREADVLNIDIGMLYQGYHTDLAKSFIIGEGKNNSATVKFLKQGKLALDEAIKMAQADNHVGDISAKIEDIIISSGYSCSLEYTGHGIGREMHQFPSVPCVRNANIENTPVLLYDMTIAIEVIYMEGAAKTKTMKDGWSVKTADGSLGACFEKTIAVGKDGPLVLTAW